jgi:hypothetical protein
MRGRPRPIASELAEIRNRRPGVRFSLAGEDLYLTAEEEVLFEQKDSERPATDAPAPVIRLGRARRRKKAPALA